MGLAQKSICPPPRRLGNIIECCPLQFINDTSTVNSWALNKYILTQKSNVHFWTAKKSKITLQSTFLIPTLDTTTKFVIMTIWMSRNLCSRADGKWEIMQKHCIKSSSNMFWIFVRITSERRFFVLKLYGPVNPMGSCRVRLVYLTTRLLGRLSPLSY